MRVYNSKLLNVWTHATYADTVVLCTSRSIFDLVKAHQVLQLTDHLLLSWYLSLSLGDRKLIQGSSQAVNACFILTFDILYIVMTTMCVYYGSYTCTVCFVFVLDEGGFQLFLQRHPALEVSQQHVYVKCKVYVQVVLWGLGRWALCECLTASSTPDTDIRGDDTRSNTTMSSDLDKYVSRGSRQSRLFAYIIRD